MKNGNMEEAGAAYQSVRDKLGKKSPLLPLVIFAMAQIDETLERYESSSTGYQALVEVEGYEELGYLGLARINELQGKPAEALAVYEQYLDSIEDAATFQRAMVEEKIARLRAEQ
jgi:DNA-binding SARP family transcriptional activator